MKWQKKQNFFLILLVVLQLLLLIKLAKRHEYEKETFKKNFCSFLKL